MIGIYNDSFLEYLKKNLGSDTIKKTSKNIICRCPWCELNKVKKHYHLYISKHAPLFHCFHAGCKQGGVIGKLLKKIEGVDISDRFIDVEELEKIKKQKIIEPKKKKKDIIIPPLKDRSLFNLKSLYIRKRLKFSNIDVNDIKGLIFDVNEFLSINKIPIDSRLFRIKDFLHNNFVGFLTENQSIVMFRNIEKNSDFSFFKLYIQKPIFMDYYKIGGNDINSKDIVLGEGIFDILTEQIFDRVGLKNHVNLYVATISAAYFSVVKSIIFYEQIFRPNIHILSDSDVGLEYYKKQKKFNSYLIDKMIIYYNVKGKDFNDYPISTEKFIL